jgi:hypothetical protein
LDAPVLVTCDPDDAVADEPGDALLHLGGGLVGERDREDPVRVDRPVTDQVGDAVGQHARLARARPRDDEQWPADVENGLTLGRVQALDQIG